MRKKKGELCFKSADELIFFQRFAILGGVFTALGMNNLDYSGPENKICFLIPVRQLLCLN